MSNRTTNLKILESSFLDYSEELRHMILDFEGGIEDCVGQKQHAQIESDYVSSPTRVCAPRGTGGDPRENGSGDGDGTQGACRGYGDEDS